MCSEKESTQTTFATSWMCLQKFLEWAFQSWREISRPSTLWSLHCRIEKRGPTSRVPSNELSFVFPWWETNMDPIEAAMRRDVPTQSAYGLVLITSIFFAAVFGFLLWFFVGHTSTRPANQMQSLPPPTYVVGPQPFPPSTQNVDVPNKLPWSYNSTPRVVRPP